MSLRAVPGTGLGILRSDQDMSAAFGKLPPLVRDRAREKTLLVLAKANSKSTVHRPVYLDYIGVKTFENGEVTGERRFLGLFSSAAYTESLTRIPVIRVKAQQVVDRAGFAPLSHTGKALMDVLETYPRDELFQTPLDELQPIAEAVLNTRERRQLRLFVRRDTYGRYLSCLVYLPRDRYTTAVRERIAEILKRQLHGDSLEYTARVSESLLARLHFVVRPKPGELVGDYNHAELERRLADAARSWRDDFVAAAHAEYGEEDGALLARKYADSFPEAYKEDYPPRTGAVDLGRLEGIPAEGGLDLSFYRPVDGGPREARLKIFRIGSPLSLSEVLPILSLDGRGGRRRAALRARRHRAAVVHLRLRAALRPGAAARGARPVPGRGQRRLGGRQRGRRVQRAGARRGAHLAAGHRAPCLREVHAAGRHPVRAGLHRGRAHPQRRHHPLAGGAVRGPLRPRPRRRRSRPTTPPGTRGPRSSSAASRRRSTTSRASTTTGSCGPT